MNLFIPKMYVSDIFHINYIKLKELGYKLIIFDLDNTIGSYKDSICNEKFASFLKKLKDDWLVVIASNSHTGRVKKFVNDLDIDYFSWSFKPTLKSLRRIQKKYKLEYSKMVIVGDQILTDILVGNRKSLFTILVDPLDNYDLKITGFNRMLEKRINKKNGIEKGKYF